MEWNEVRKQFPNKWLLFAAIKSHMTKDKHRIIDELAPIHAYADFYKEWDHYSVLHAKELAQRLYVYHTSNDQINIKLQHWAGVRE